MVLSVPIPSSRVNCNSFFDFGTATHSLTFTARKSDLLNVSKSTNSSNKGSTFALEKSIFSDSVFTFFQVLQKLYYLHHFSYLHHLRTSLWGRKRHLGYWVTKVVFIVLPQMICCPILFDTPFLYCPIRAI